MSENLDQARVERQQATMDRIKGENEALIKRLKELEERRFHRIPQAKRGGEQERSYGYQC
ncbi:hypothetical protein BKA70DRAFT_1570645 [Coprinopsis sp. MPI-PUGE-AT-0042]|nr:hypothetical protein BKA70DRAFT_1570645 [Coprinopsis sp. MPI-PUGE-AT-0042]